MRSLFVTRLERPLAFDLDLSHLHVAVAYASYSPDGTHPASTSWSLPILRTIRHCLVSHTLTHSAKGRK